MKPASGPPSNRKAIPPWVCVLINLAAFPGLGTILARRRGGYVQAAIMVGGFVLVMVYMLCYLGAVVRYLMNSNWTEAQFQSLYRPYTWALYYGLALCGIAWLSAMLSSIQVWRHRNNAPQP